MGPARRLWGCRGAEARCGPPSPLGGSAHGTARVCRCGGPLLSLAAGCGAAPPSGTPARTSPPTPPSTAPSSTSSPAPSASGALPADAQSLTLPHTSFSSTGGVRAPQLTSIAFANARDGWVVINGRIEGTTDGGAGWSALPVPGTARLVAFLNAEDGWDTLSTGLIQTTAGGASWTTLAGPALWSLDFVSPTTGYAVSGTSRRSTPPKTTDGGRVRPEGAASGRSSRAGRGGRRQGRGGAGRRGGRVRPAAPPHECAPVPGEDGAAAAVRRGAVSGRLSGTDARRRDATLPTCRWQGARHET